MYKVISFYRYVSLQNIEVFRKEIAEKCIESHILGRILLGHEGINGAVCGDEKSIVKFQSFLEQSFPSLTYREQDVKEQSYHKLVVRLRKEIVVFGKNVSVEHTGKHLSPQELDSWYKEKKDFVIIDARNVHEAEVGKFKDAFVLPIKHFRDFPEAIKKFENLKEKKVVVYCTGGIRCEKASAYMKQEGFTDVYQVDGGIINYVNQFPEGFYEGSCFVFDDRLSSYIEKPISRCTLCHAACAEYTNCYNLDCDTLFICCSTCREKMKNTCSLVCKDAPRQRIMKEKNKELPIVGVVENYYPHAKVALVRLEGDISVQSSVLFQGTTTKSIQEKIVELRDYDGNVLEKAQRGMRITFPVQEKVRTHDIMVLMKVAE